MLHGRTCMIVGRVPRRGCRNARCQNLKQIKEHVQSSQEGASCWIPLSSTIPEYKGHWESCKNIRCLTWKEMRFASIERFFSDLNNYPQLIPDHLTLSRNGRDAIFPSKFNFSIESLYPNTNYTDIQDEKLKTETIRAQLWKFLVMKVLQP